jgi:cell fate regulator YaaT (PSP1 superfamily)
MFISKQEKQYLFDQIKGLSKDMSLAASEITFLKAKIKILDGKPAVVVAKKPKTLAQKKKQAQYMRTYMAKKKAAKLALEQA